MFTVGALTYGNVLDLFVEYLCSLRVFHVGFTRNIVVDVVLPPGTGTPGHSFDARNNAFRPVDPKAEDEDDKPLVAKRTVFRSRGTRAAKEDEDEDKLLTVFGRAKGGAAPKASQDSWV